MKKVISFILATLLVCSMSNCAFAHNINYKIKKSNSLVIYTTMTDNDIDCLLSVLSEKYPQLDVEIVCGGVGILQSRIRSEAQDPQGDVHWGGLMPSDGDKNDDIYMLYTSPYEKDLPEQYRSHNGRYNQDHISTIVFCVNIELEKKLGFQIRTYEDLLRPELKGKFIISDPNTSSAAWNNLSNIFAVYGYDSPEAWDLIRKLFENGLVIVSASSECFKAIDRGEYVVGLTYEDGACTLLKDGSDRIRLQYPENGASASSMGCAIIQNCKNLDNAKLFIDFLMSPEGQDAFIEKQQTERFTNPNTKKKPKYLPDSDTIKWVYRDNKWLTENKAKMLEKWSNLCAEVYKNKE